MGVVSVLEGATQLLSFLAESFNCLALPRDMVVSFVSSPDTSSLLLRHVVSFASIAGSPSCFLFTLLPTFGVYEATGYNNNFVYLEQNAQTLPNGLVSTPAQLLYD